MTKLRTVLTGVGLAAALALAACAGGDDEPAEDPALTATNGSVVEVPLEDVTVEAIPETETPALAPAEPEAAANASVDAPPPADPVAAEEQIIDDAEATGMTSRLPAEGEEAAEDAAANEAE